MSTTRIRFSGTADQISNDAASRTEVGRNRTLPGGAFCAARARRARGLALALVLVCLLALPPLAPAEAIPPPAPAVAPDAPSDEYWAVGFHSPGMSGSVSALVMSIGQWDSTHRG